MLICPMKTEKQTKTSILTLLHYLPIPVEQQQLVLEYSALKSLGAEFYAEFGGAF